ncbi:hypothetical protein LA080_007521 [Diaporthe eres]|nr:hypothetical protein LA080_007521 [Diaporthe eres]
MHKTLDPAILAVLPAGCKVIAVKSHGKGSWSTGHKIIRRPRHLELAKGEFESQAELKKYLPENTVAPLAYGPLELDSSASFFLSPFRNLSDKTPEPTQLAEVLEKLHKTSVSPNGKFGFHITTFNGIIRWSMSAATPGRNSLAASFGRTSNGNRTVATTPDRRQEYQACPRPRRSRPGNVQIDRDTQRVILFDSCCCYAHNELDLGMMREPRYRFTCEHASKYLESMRPSQPEEDFDDRNAIYAM